MEQDVRTTLRTLLHDKNLPETVCEAALEHLLDEFVQSDDPLQACWQFIRTLDDGFNRGPIAPIPSKHIRVAKFLSFEHFLIFHADRVLVLEEDNVDRLRRMFRENNHSLSDLLPRTGSRLTNARNGVNWTTLDSETRELKPQNIRDEFGLNFLQTTDIVKISYELETKHLRIPTVLDAGLSPWFVSKPKLDEDLPRAWNWQQDRWGLPEFVHPVKVDIQNPQLELIRSPAQFSSGMDRLSSFAQIYSKELEDIVSQILSRATAHRELLAFLSGSSDVLTLSHRDFEIFVGHLYQRTGFKTEVTKASRDGGFDVIAISDPEGQNGLLIQAKHTSGVVGIRVIRELLGARLIADEPLRNYMLVVCTTGRFSRPAKEAQNKFTLELELVDYENLQQKLRKFKDVGVKDIVADALNFLRSSP